MAMYRHWVFISRAGTMLHLVLHRHGIVYPDNAHVECRIYEQRVIPNEVKPTVTLLHVFQCSLIATAIIVIVVFSVVRETLLRYYITQQISDSEMSFSFPWRSQLCIQQDYLKQCEICNVGHGDLIIWVSETNIGLLFQWMNCLFLKRYLIAFSQINGILADRLRSFSDPPTRIHTDVRAQKI